MKITKKAYKEFIKDTTKWFNWVYDKNQSHFFTFCEYHEALVFRGRDLDCVNRIEDPVICDYPGCLEQAYNEYFPNFELVLRKSNEKHTKRKSVRKGSKNDSRKPRMDRRRTA